MRVHYKVRQGAKPGGPKGGGEPGPWLFDTRSLGDAPAEMDTGAYL